MYDFLLIYLLCHLFPSKPSYRIVGIINPVSSPNFSIGKKPQVGAQRLINLEIPVLIRSLKSSNIELGQYLDGRLFKCCLSAAANPLCRTHTWTYSCITHGTSMGTIHLSRNLADAHARI